MSEPPVPAESAKRRIPVKLLLVGGGAGVLIAVLGAVAVWLLAGSAPTARHAKARPAAAVSARASDAASAPAVQPVAAASAAELAASTAEAEASPHVAHDASPGDGATGAAGVPPAVSTAVVSHTAVEHTTGAGIPAGTAHEAPMESLRRRLGQVLGARGQVDPGPHGELRLVARQAPAPGPERVIAAPAAETEREPSAAASHAEGGHWAYDGRNGPQAWGRLAPEYTRCASGSRQSPIDIRDGLSLDLDPVQFDYHAGPFQVVDNGHTVQVEVAPGSSIVVAGKRYELKQFHFHRPSEERIDGRRFDMGLHLVHRDAEGRLAVVAVLLDRGDALPALQTVWNHLPLEKHEPATVDVPLDPAQLLPVDRRYFTYIGSLTTPPCTEGVRWVVLQQPVGLSPRQIDVFARLYPMNARPTQATAGRMIQQSN